VEEAEGEEMRAVKEEAKEDKNTVEFTLDDELMVTSALDPWKESGAYREHNLTLITVAEQMNIPSRLLHTWLHRSEYGKLATLVTTLRIEEAKRVLRNHPDWNVDSVAEYCGFNGRKYFHQVFLEHTGTTPAKFERA
jgi:AraC-like DNA-binding protein